MPVIGTLLAIRTGIFLGLGAAAFWLIAGIDDGLVRRSKIYLARVCLLTCRSPTLKNRFLPGIHFSLPDPELPFNTRSIESDLINSSIQMSQGDSC
jgi:hypothetical protein